MLPKKHTQPVLQSQNLSKDNFYKPKIQNEFTEMILKSIYKSIWHCLSRSIRVVKMWSCHHWKYLSKGWISLFVRDEIQSVFHWVDEDCHGLTTQDSTGSGNTDKRMPVSCSSTLASYTPTPCQESKGVKMLESRISIPKCNHDCRQVTENWIGF